MIGPRRRIMIWSIVICWCKLYVIMGGAIKAPATSRRLAKHPERSLQPSLKHPRRRRGLLQMEGAPNCCLIVVYVTYDKVELPLYLSTVSVKLNGEKAGGEQILRASFDGYIKGYLFKVGQMWVRGQSIQDKLRVIIIQAGLVGIKLMLPPTRGCFHLDQTQQLRLGIRSLHLMKKELLCFINRRQSHHHTSALTPSSPKVVWETLSLLIVEVWITTNRQRVTKESWQLLQRWNKTTVSLFVFEIIHTTQKKKKDEKQQEDNSSSKGRRRDLKPWAYFRHLAQYFYNSWTITGPNKENERRKSILQTFS